MERHPDHPAIRHLQALKSMSDACTRDALDVAIDSIRAVSEMRPKHPRTVVGQRYAQLIVSYPALRRAQTALGDWDLGRLDVDALVAQVQTDRERDAAEMDRDDVRSKWGA